MQNTITKGMILNLSSNADVYARGERNYREGKLLSVKTEEKDGLTEIIASVEGNYKNYQVLLRLEPNGKLKYYECNCESHSIWRGACKHVVTALFSLMDGAGAYLHATDLMRKETAALTDALEKLIFQDIDNQLGEISQSGMELARLSPCFHSDERGETFLSLTVGIGRMYIVKNIQNFLMNVRREEIVGYGNKLKFSHAESMFDSESRRLLSFLMREESIYMEVSKQFNRYHQYGYNAYGHPRFLRLSERNMDDFFNLYVDKIIDSDTSEAKKLLLTTDPPNISFRINNEEDKTFLTAEPVAFSVKQGLKHHYIITRDAIHRTEKNDALILMHLFRTMTQIKESKLVFTGGEQQRFLSVVLPRINRMGLISSMTGDIPHGKTADLITKLFFDYAKEDVVGRVEYHYGEDVVNPMDEAPMGLLRDTAEEYRIKRRLAVAGFHEDPVRGEYVLTGNDAIYAFLNGDGSEREAGINTLRGCAEVYVSDALQNKTVKVKSATVGVRLQGNLLDVTLEDSGFSLTELMEAMEAYRSKKKYHRLKDGRFLPLDGEEIAPVAELLTALDVSKKDIHNHSISLPAYRALYVDGLINDHEDNWAVNRNMDFEKLIAQFKDVSSSGFEPPETLDGVLRGYQKIGFQWLKSLASYGFGGILADDMGLGKTLQVITVLLSDQRPGEHSLVVAPTSLLYNWDSEIKRFAPQLTTVVVSGQAEKRMELITQTTNADVYITTYDMMKRDILHYANLNFEYLIADEAQNIKNPATQNAKAIKEIRARIRFALTGTPIENTLTELWSIFDFIMPGYLYSSHRFNRQYEYPIVKNNDRERAEQLRRQISPFVLRRIKKNVLTELPDKTETMLLAEMYPEQRKLYLANLLKAKGEFDKLTQRDGFAGSRIAILAQLTRLRQICCHPGLFAENYHGGSGKLDLTLETIQMAVESGHRILLFSQFTSMLDIMRRGLDETPFSYFYLDGATLAQSRMDMMNRFNAGERDLFLISLKAGGTGLNLTGADVVIHYDPWWNPSVMDQASDRAHRYGQEKAVQIFNIVAKDSIEEKIMELQEKKRGLIDSVITEGGSFINTLSEDEVRALFTAQ